MPEDATSDTWQYQVDSRIRLGEILRERRGQLDPRYAEPGGLALFIRERSSRMAPRLFQGLEKPGRQVRNYDAGTVAGFAMAYEVDLDWLHDALDGNITPLRPATGRAVIRPVPDKAASEGLQLRRVVSEVTLAMQQKITERQLADDVQAEVRRARNRHGPAAGAEKIFPDTPATRGRPAQSRAVERAMWAMCEPAADGRPAPWAEETIIRAIASWRYNTSTAAPGAELSG